MSGNLPDDVTPADIDRHFGPPDHEHEFHEPYDVEADETLAIYQQCVEHRGGRYGQRCETTKVTYYRPDRIEVIDDEGDVILTVSFPSGYDHVDWADEIHLAIEREVNDQVYPDPVEFDPTQDEIGLRIDPDTCPLEWCDHEHRLVYIPGDVEVIR